jgi:hypothetical protein
MKNRIRKLLRESSLNIRAKDLPPSIANWIKARFGSIPAHIELIQGKTVMINLPWHEADRVTYQAFEMVGPNQFKPIGSSLTRSGNEGMFNTMRDEEVAIPAGGLVVRYDTYPRKIRIYTGEGAQPMLVDTTPAEDLSNDAILALYVAKSLKSFARPKFDQSVYDELISKGYMAKNKSITPDGRNILSMLKDRIKDAISEYNEKADKDWKMDHIYYSGI